MMEFESTEDNDAHWLGAALRGPEVVVSCVNDPAAITTSTVLTSGEVRELASWLIDAYEEMGFEFPGLDRL